MRFTIVAIVVAAVVACTSATIIPGANEAGVEPRYFRGKPYARKEPAPMVARTFPVQAHVHARDFRFHMPTH